MFLATLKVSMDLEPEVPSQDRERVMRSLRDKVRQSFNQRVIARTDDDVSLFMALYDDSFERATNRIETVVELIDKAGEARIALSHAQIFSWFEGSFVETKESIDLQIDAQPQKSDDIRLDKMIVYKNEDIDDENGTKFDRRQMRIPTRK